MDVTAALDLVWTESTRSSQALVAEAIGVTPSVVTGWKGGTIPKGKNRAKLLHWAESRPAPIQSMSDYHRGVLHAARAMSSTVAALLAEFDAPDVQAIDAASLRATPTAPDRPKPDEGLKVEEG